MPKLWTETIETHRREVRDAILDNTATLAAELGLRSVTMSQIAEQAGIGRATLYKYFPSVEAILVAWHERQVGEHLAHLSKVRDHQNNAGEGLAAVLEAYALMSREHGRSELAALVHQGEPMLRAQHQLSELLEGMLSNGALTGELRDDVSPDELANYCMHAVAAASRLSSKAAVRRLVTLTMDGLRPSSPAPTPLS